MSDAESSIFDPIVSAKDPRYMDAYGEILQLAANRPQGGYKVIYIDDPWYYENWSHKGANRGALKHYACMDDDLLCRLPIGALAADNSVMFMWCVWPKIFAADRLIVSRGFEYSGLAWEWIKKNPDTGKYSFGGGYGTRKNLEPCILARRGNPKLKTRSERDFLYAPRREHSRKPHEAYEKIERMFDGPYIELFGRNRRDGWDSWGNEIDKFEGVA